MTFVKTLITIAAIATSVASVAHAKEKQKAGVNYDDPNLAFTPEYASDSAIPDDCPKTLKGKKLRECLARTSGEEISERAEFTLDR